MSATILLEKTLHYPVLLNEVINIITPQNGGTFIDCTFGQGGYSKKILEYPNTKVIAIDRDKNSLHIASDLKKKFEDRFYFHNIKFSQIKDLKIDDEVKGIIFDLGYSLNQIKDLSRGLSFESKGDLNMKMGLNDFSAKDVINKLDQKELEQIFKYFGEEKNSKLISKKIVVERQKKNLDTQDLVNIVKRAKKKYYTKTNPATKVFQALRIFVNKEISELTRGLEESSNIVGQNGIILTVSFHSLEDKICKFFFNQLSKQDKVSRYLPEKKSTKISFSLITKKPVIPGSQELKLNPPSRSAKLRAIKKIDTYENNKNVFLKYKNLLNIENFSEKL
ncbi:16S rRNA (cytosine(1402)-N(4))-methyltransferase RsmH [Candidatus Pelagibacter sp.]|nr:16S rRNA (cytosine(1402)-N(4))-methyltransferase RsmH [Candidatus Pelagibacter sp.]